MFKVVRNEKGHYSLWSLELADPIGWNSAGFQGTKEECLAYIENVWTDLTP